MGKSNKSNNEEAEKREFKKNSSKNVERELDPLSIAEKLNQELEREKWACQNLRGGSYKSTLETAKAKLQPPLDLR